jgi:hypothetical protein
LLGRRRLNPRVSHRSLFLQDKKADKAEIDAAVNQLKELKIELEAAVKACPGGLQ